MISPSSVTRGVAITVTPTCSNVYDDSGFTFAPPDAIGENVVVRYGSLAPMFSVNWAPSAPRSCVWTSTFVCVSVSRK